MVPRKAAVVLSLLMLVCFAIGRSLVRSSTVSSSGRAATVMTLILRDVVRFAAANDRLPDSQAELTLFGGIDPTDDGWSCRTVIVADDTDGWISISIYPTDGDGAPSTLTGYSLRAVTEDAVGKLVAGTEGWRRRVEADWLRAQH